MTRVASGNPAGRRRGWTADHFLIEGRYCPPSEIRRWLAEWRERQSLEWVVLLPFPTDGTTMFGSLMHVDHQDVAMADAVGVELAVATTPETARALAGVLARLAAEAAPRGKSARVPDDANRLILDSPILDVLEELWNEPPPFALWRPRSWFPRGGVRYFVLSSATRDRPRQAHLLRILRDDRLSELEPSLHATHQVALHLHEGRNPREPAGNPTERRPQATLSVGDLRPAKAMTHFGPAHEYEDLLARALIVTRADLGALYLVERSGDGLSLVASVGTRRAPLQVDMEPSRSTLAFAVNRARPRVTNNARTEAAHSTIGLPWLGNAPEPADFSEIVVPVSGLARDRAVIGALIAQKRARADSEVFDVHDLNELELVSSRVALRRSNLLFEEVTDRLSELTGHNMLASSGSTDLDALDGTWRELPADVVSARPSLQRAVHLAHSYTPARATVLYLLDRKQQRLVPAAVEGEASLFAEPIELSSTSNRDGLAAAVVTTGNGIYVRDYNEPGALKPFGGRLSREGRPHAAVRSELALPITIFDRTVGVLLIASEQAGALESTHSFSAAVAHQIGAALLLAQRAEEQRAFVFASSTAVHAHEILKRVDVLLALPDESTRQIGDEIKRLVDSLRETEAETGHARDPVEIVTRAVVRVGLSEFVVWRTDPTRLPPVSPSVAIALERAADELLRNAKFRMVSDGRSTRVTIRTRLTIRGGLPRLVLEITNCASTVIAPGVEAKIYRSPVEDTREGDHRRHFGAFTAGYWMRAVGGDVYISQNEQAGQVAYVSTTIEVPLLTLAPVGGGGGDAEIPRPAG